MTTNTDQLLKEVIDKIIEEKVDEYLNKYLSSDIEEVVEKNIEEYLSQNNYATLKDVDDVLEDFTNNDFDQLLYDYLSRKVLHLKVEDVRY